MGSSRHQSVVVGRWPLVAIATAAVIGLSSLARAEDAPPYRSWGLSIWGVSYHVNRSIDYDEANLGVGVRYYFTRYLFVEGDVLRNSNRGVVLPVSVGAEIGFGSVGKCGFAAVAAATVAYYRNPRTDSDYFKVGPVPGMAITCGRAKTNVVVILSPSHDPIAAIAASLTILL